MKQVVHFADISSDHREDIDRAHKIAQGIHEKSGTEALQHLLMHLPGLKIRHFTFGRRGFDCIDENSNLIQNKGHTRRITKELNTKGSIIFGWKESLVKEIMRGIANEAVLCQEHLVCPATLRNVKRPFLVGVLKSMVKTMGMHALAMIGEPEIGKTFAGRAAALARARRRARKIGGERVAALKSTTEFDFLSGQPGGKSRAWAHDNGALNEQRARAIKSFTDAGGDEATLANLMACLKRSDETVNFTHADGNSYVLHRLDSEGAEPVPCFVLGESNFINMGGRRRIGLWEKGDPQFGADYDQGVLREQNWLAQLMGDGEVPPGPDDDSGAEDVSAAAEPQPFDKLSLGDMWGRAAAAPGASSLAEFKCAKKGAVNDGPDALKKPAPAKKEERGVEQERALRAPITRGPEGPCRAAGSTEKADNQKVFSATPVGEATMQKLSPGRSGVAPEKGKLRTVLRRPSATKAKDWKNAPYVRAKNATPGGGLRREQATCKRAVPELLAASDVEIVNILLDDKLLVDWTGGDRLLHRCNAKGCQKHEPPARQNPIFSEHSASESLQKQAVALLAKLAGNVWQARRMHVEDVEPTIEYRKTKAWADVEADEATFDKLDLTGGPEPLEDPSRPAMWEQWLGIAQRGRPRALTLARHSPEMAGKRAPGPGAARMRWLLKDRSAIFHTGPARSCKLNAPGVIHDFVKKVLIPPKYVGLTTHVLPSGKHLKVKSGAQFINRTWRFIKNRIHRNANAKAGTNLLATKGRSVQCGYWHKDDDMWAKTGDMVQHIMRDQLTA
ncbi:unnamed protein product [Prorocentrum cordatum]|uniref:Uncharacterized protein n=1 Tax=Prorocentrum cordatum TaxID=2364126 RepID=A0ABN9TMW7_9DINO|nr:unnamed protein product [Polarella glacialis]